MFLYKDISDHTVLSIKLTDGWPIVAVTLAMLLEKKGRVIQYTTIPRLCSTYVMSGDHELTKN